MQTRKNRFDRMEWSGAFGDIGTLFPFLAGFILVAGFEATGILWMFGVSMIIAGMVFKTPIAVQPMKVIGGAVIAQGASMTSGTIFAAGFFLGVLWLFLASTNLLTYIEKLVTKPIVYGIMLALGIRFMTNGIAMMAEQWYIAVPVLVVMFLLLQNTKIPAMFFLLFVGVAIGFYNDSTMIGQIFNFRQIAFHLPSVEMRPFSWYELLAGAVTLGIPQASMSISNALLATAEEHNRLAPERKVTVKQLAIMQGIKNVIAPFIGGIPLCYGVGGMVGQMRFGARTGGAPIIMGALLVVTALFFQQPFMLLLQVFPVYVIGVALFITGLELAVSMKKMTITTDHLYILILTAGFAMWNMGAGLLAGVLLQQMSSKQWVIFEKH